MGSRSLNVNEAIIRRELAALAGSSTRLEALARTTRIPTGRLKELSAGARPTAEELRALSESLVAARGDA